MQEKKKISAQQLTLEEKAGLCSGAGFWFTKAIERLGIEPVMVADGPNGIRKQMGAADHLGMSESVKAVCFPTGSAVGASFDPELARLMGSCLGEEADIEGLHTVLGPAVNIKRSPLGGRNFEFLSEDPFLTGELGAAYVEGLQEQHTGACVKHFAANNQEKDRMSVDVRVSERALREVYLAGFEKIVRQAKPWAVMCAYNLINGCYCCENPWLLQQILREEWNFDGIVMTDWGAMNDRCRALAAGLELEMPSSGGHTDRQLVAAVHSGQLKEEILDQSVDRLLTWIEKGRKYRPEAANGMDLSQHHQIARKIAGECAVLLKNNGVLPLKKDEKLAFIGEFAAVPRYQGGGSSHVNSTWVSDALSCAKSQADICYVPGFSADGKKLGEEAFREAIQVAKSVQCAVIFAGLPDSWESEGYDRMELGLPDEQNRLISAVASVQPNTIVVLHNGSPVTVPWHKEVAAILEMHLAGEAVGEATTDILFGDVNPSGKLAETYPLRVQDTPAWLNLPGDGKTVYYHEDIYVGYRWYDARELDVLYPFGYGLSYTSFDYKKLRLSRDVLSDRDDLNVIVTVKNTGSRIGKEVVQVYVHAEEENGSPMRPLRQLCGFAKVELYPGEERNISIPVEARCFAYFEERLGRWYTPSGDYTILAGPHSRALPLKAKLTVRTQQKLPLTADDTTTVGDVLQLGNPEQIAILNTLLRKTTFGVQAEDDEGRMGAGTKHMLEDMKKSLPLHALRSFGNVSNDELESLLAAIRCTALPEPPMSEFRENKKGIN